MVTGNVDNLNCISFLKQSVPTPAASFTVTPTELSVQFDTSASSAAGGISSYSWDFGDGNQSQGKTVSHVYQTAGTYTITLTVTDKGTPALTGKTTREITVTNPPAVQPCTNRKFHGR